MRIRQVLMGMPMLHLRDTEDLRAGGLEGRIEMVDL